MNSTQPLANLTNTKASVGDTVTVYGNRYNRQRNDNDIIKLGAFTVTNNFMGVEGKSDNGVEWCIEGGYVSKRNPNHKRRNRRNWTIVSSSNPGMCALNRGTDEQR